MKKKNKGKNKLTKRILVSTLNNNTTSKSIGKSAYIDDRPWDMYTSHNYDDVIFMAGAGPGAW